jgi:hypothetical protein
MSLPIAMVTKESISLSFETMLGGASGSNGAFPCDVRHGRSEGRPSATPATSTGAQTRTGTSIFYIAHWTVSARVIEHGADEEQAIGAGLLDAAEDQGESELRRKWALIRYW